MLAIGKTLTPQQRLSKCVIDILGKERYTALNGVVMIGARAVKPCPPFNTACTNGRDEYYDPAMVDELTDAEMRYVILHENYHKMYRHLTTWVELFKLDAELAGKACDYVINLQISDDNKDGFATMPKGKYEGLLDERFRGMSAAQVFNILRKEQAERPKGKGQGQGKGESQGEGGEPDGFDTHDWEGAQELTEAEKHQLERDIDEALRQGALAAGKVGTGGKLDIGELLKPQVNWREALREFVCTTCAGNEYSTYRRPNRRFMNTGIYMPSGISDAVGELVYAFDMSGSTGMGRMRPAFITEGQSVCDTVTPEKLRVLYWDTKVAADEVYVGEEVKGFAKNTKPAGGGGTVVRCVSDYLQEHKIKPQAVVIFTDGDIFGGDHGTWDCPVMWCVVDHPGRNMKFGKTIHVDSTLG